MHDRIEVLLQARKKWRSDDDCRAQKIFAKLEEVTKDNRGIMRHMDTTLTPLVVNCVEQLNMQIAAEE